MRMPTEKYVWYACYGSNLYSERFYEYIKECTNKTLPREDMPFTIPYPLYFAKFSTRWRGAIAFIGHIRDDAESSLGRIWLITEEQFEEIKMQEGPNYTREIELGNYRTYPIKTFTNEREIENAPPSKTYLEVIEHGLRQTYPLMRKEEIDAYLDRARSRKVIRQSGK
jgi:hypothetical protein